MAVHDEVLQAALARCGATHSWRFRVEDVVRALPHLNAGTVRTHVTSRCCVNAPKNHAHKWAYFRRVGRGVYEVMASRRSVRLTETDMTLRDTLHISVSRSDGRYTAECLELPVVTEATDLNALIHALREAISLHLDDEDRAALGLAPRLRLLITAEFPLAISA
jgi:hypothetical protein